MEPTPDDFKNAFERHEPKPVGRHARYAVLAPVVARSGVLHFLFEVRAAGLRRQPGEIAFPGGRIEPGETPAVCAVRETAEELGIAPESVSLIGESDYLTERGGFTLYCFVGMTEDADFERLANPDEVEAVFLVPVSFFTDNEPEVYDCEFVPKLSPRFEIDGCPAEDYPWRGTKTVIPVYRYGERVIWGLTARLVQRLTEILKAATV